MKYKVIETFLKPDEELEEYLNKLLHQKGYRLVCVGVIYKYTNGTFYQFIMSEEEA